MVNLRDLYQEIIIDHNRNPRNFGKLENADRTAEGFNPLCGDRLNLYLKLDDDKRITDMSFDGSGCAISVASASLMTDTLKGKTLADVNAVFNQFHHLVTTSVPVAEEQTVQLGKLAALLGVRDYPVRVKCATLCWHTLQSALKGDKTPVSTE
jgi:nitrogen fixation protein NifU and related proteins